MAHGEQEYHELTPLGEVRSRDRDFEIDIMREVDIVYRERGSSSGRKAQRWHGLIDEEGKISRWEITGGVLSVVKGLGGARGMRG